MLPTRYPRRLALGYGLFNDRDAPMDGVHERRGAPTWGAERRCSMRIPKFRLVVSWDGNRLKVALEPH